MSNSVSDVVLVVASQPDGGTRWTMSRHCLAPGGVRGAIPSWINTILSAKTVTKDKTELRLAFADSYNPMGIAIPPELNDGV